MAYAGADQADAIVRRRCGVGRLAVGVVTVCVLVLGLGGPAWGSQLPAEEDGGAARGERPVLDDRVVKAQVRVVWPSGRLGYALADRQYDNLYRTLIAVDLDSGVEVGQVPLPFGAADIGAVDDAGGRLFLYEATNLGEHVKGQGPSVSKGNAGAVSPELAAAQSGNVCAYTNVSGAGVPCVVAVWEVDARSLVVGKRMALPSLRAEGLMTTPVVEALSFAAARGAEDAAKLLVVRREYVDWAVSAAASQHSPSGRANATQVFVSQIDAGSGVLEWTYRLDACKATRTPSADYYQMIQLKPAAAAVFRDPRPDGRWVFVACSSGGGANSGTVVRVPLDERGYPPGLPVVVGDPAGAAGRLRDEGLAFRPAAGDVGGAAPGPEVFVGPEKAYELRADAVSGRVLMTVVDGVPRAQVVWVFDALNWRMLGTIGVGPVSEDMSDTMSGTDWVNGRMYVLVADENASSRAGLYLIDFRRTPLAQPLWFPEFGPIGLLRTEVRGLWIWMTALPASEGRPATLFVPDAVPDSYDTGPGRFTWTPWASMRVVVDPVAFAEDPEALGERRTLDLVEAEGVTGVALDGAARGFGARALLIGGAEAASRVGPVDPVGNVLQWRDQTQVGGGPQRVNCGGSGELSKTGEPCWDTAGDPRVPCGAVNREVVLGFVGPRGAAVVDAGGSRGGAEPVVVDSATTADGEALVSRCGGVVDAISDWDGLWAGALFGRPPVDEPAVPALGTDKGVECVSSDQQSASSGDPVAGTFAAKVDCSEEEASGFAYTRGFAAGLTSVGEALSSFRIYRDPGRGIVSRVEAVSRGIGIDGVLRIDTVRGTAESWANGRSQPVAAADREAGYDPNCDFERSAGSCFTRNVFGVWTPGYSCGPCGDEAQLVERMNKSFGSYGSVRFRQPDATLAAGSADGFTAAVQKTDAERFADLVLNSDLLQTVVPSLEIVRFAPPNRPVTSGGPRGRQIYQFAGVEVSSSYAISCLLVFDEASNTCGAAKETPGSITVSLADSDGTPLAGGAFEVRADVDADGLLGLKDTLLPDGACVTADDGIGTCTLDNLRPGGYLVVQTAAPAGYGKIAEPYVVELASGEARTVAFTNTSNVSTIAVSAADEAGKPLSGAQFAVYPDPDSDGKVAADAKPAASCTTDADGACSMQVPAGSYVLVQTAAPGGLEGIEPVAFTFASGGQTAAVGVVNYPPGAPAQPEGAAAPVVYTPPVEQAPPVEVVAPYEPAPIAEPAQVSLPDVVGGTIVRVIRAPGDALRLLSRDPAQAVAWTATLALFMLAVLAVRRRHLLGTMMFAPAGAGPAFGERPVPPGATRAATPTTAVLASALLDGSVVAGAAPHPTEQVNAHVVVAVASPALSALVATRLMNAERIAVTAVVNSFDALREALSRTDGAVLIVDLSMSTDSAYDVCDLIHSIHPPERTIGLIPPQRSAEALITRGHQAAIAGLLSIDDDIGNGSLAYAVRCVAVGKLYYGPAVQAVLIGRWGGRLRRRGMHAARGLTARELQVARLAAAGMRRTQIAQQLHVSPETVKRHLYAVRAKLGVTNPRSRDELHRRLADSGLLDDSKHEES